MNAYRGTRLKKHHRTYQQKWNKKEKEKEKKKRKKKEEEKKDPKKRHTHTHTHTNNQKWVLRVKMSRKVGTIREGSLGEVVCIRILSEKVIHPPGNVG